MFLLPNFLGFVIFTAGPVIFALVASFTNWDLLRPHKFEFIGIENFKELLRDGRFWSYLINTLYLMLGLPISIAGSLFLAMSPEPENPRGHRVSHAFLSADVHVRRGADDHVEGTAQSRLRADQRDTALDLGAHRVGKRRDASMARFDVEPVGAGSRACAVLVEVLRPRREGRADPHGRVDRDRREQHAAVSGGAQQRSTRA